MCQLHSSASPQLLDNRTGHLKKTDGTSGCWLRIRRTIVSNDYADYYRRLTKLFGRWRPCEWCYCCFPSRYCRRSASDGRRKNSECDGELCVPFFRFCKIDMNCVGICTWLVAMHRAPPFSLLESSFHVCSVVETTMGSQHKLFFFLL